MGNPLAIIASDLHLKPRTWKHRPIVGDSYNAWDQVVSGAIEYQVSYVILAGDLLDRQLNGSEPIIKLKEGLDRLEKAGITTLFIQGQHEYQESPWASLSGSIHLHGHYPVEVGPFKIFGIDYQSKEELLPAIGMLPMLATDRNILVMHQVWQDWMGERALPQGKFEDVLNATPELEVLITGDLHEQRLESHRNASGSETTVLSPGSTCVQSIAEPLEKFFYVLRDDDGKAAFLPVAINNRPIFRYPKTLETVGDVEEALACVEEEWSCADGMAHLQDLPEDLRTPIFQYVYSHEVASEVGRLEKRLDGRVHLFWKEIPDKSAEFIEAFAAGVSVTMKDVLRERVEEGKIRDLAERLLVSPDPAEELLRWGREKAEQETQ